MRTLGLAIAAALLTLPDPARADDFAAWRHHGAMYILTTPDGADLPASASIDGFPLLVRLNGDFLDFTQCRPDGADIRFSADDGTPLAFRVEEWNPAGGSATVWVRIPHIAGNARQPLRIHWGNATAAPASDGKAVFNESNGFCSVWHMNEPVTDDVGRVESKDEGTSPTRGIVGDARHLAGGQGVFAGDDIATYPKGMGPMTTSAWFRAERVNGTVVAWGKEKRPAKVMMNFLSPPRIAIQCYFADVDAKRTLATGEWYQVVHTYAPKDSRVYINGVLEGTSRPELDIPGTSALWIGGWYGNYNFVGDVDEVRIASVARSADWVRLEYENQKPMQTAVGPIVRDGTEFTLSDDAITLDEGARVTVRARIGGAQKIVWTLVKDGARRVVSTDTLACSVDAGRVSGDAQASLECKVVRADGVATKSVAIAIREAIADPDFTLEAPTQWDGRSPLTVTPRLTGHAEGALRVRWSVGDFAVTHAAVPASGGDPGALRLTRAERSGTATVTATIDNGGTPVTRRRSIAVREPERDAWVHRTPGADEQPEDGQFYARDDRDEAILVWNGRLDASSDGVFLRVLADGRPFAESRAKPDAEGRYALSATLKPGLVRYSAEFGTTTKGTDTLVRTVANLVCGDAFVIDGQSNAVATDWGKGDFNESSEWIRTFGSTGGNPGSVRWGNAVRRGRDGELAIGFWAYELAARLVEGQKVPICIINGAVGGTRVDQHQRDHANPEDRGTIYGRLLWRVRQARLEDGIRGIFWHQGENDQGADGPAGGYGYETYRELFLQMAGAWREDYPNIQHAYMFQIWPKACAMGRDGSDDRLREVQRTLPRAFAHMSIMSSLGIEPEGGCHYPAEGYAQMARLIAPLVEQFNYGVMPTGSITPPDLVRARFEGAARDAVVLEFDQPVRWDAALASQFFLDGAKVDFTSSDALGATVTLRLTAPTDARTISYIDGDRWSQKTILRGENGIAALTFCEVPIEPARPPRSDPAR
ncbi:MAG: DUF2341 domain-containing protein [Planctomycetaceae bacterium]|nr:DUF2341 domain-containing protein [Planctomycetaceae bacterium]